MLPTIGCFLFFKGDLMKELIQRGLIVELSKGVVKISTNSGMMVIIKKGSMTGRFYEASGRLAALGITMDELKEILCLL